MKQIAIGSYLENIGRAADKIIIDYPDFVDEQDHIPWSEIRKMKIYRMFDENRQSCSCTNLVHYKETIFHNYLNLLNVFQMKAFNRQREKRNRKVHFGNGN